MWKLHRYKQAENYEVDKWLIESLKLTPYQQDVLRTEEIVRFSKFTFLKVAIIFLFLLILLFCCCL